MLVYICTICGERAEANSIEELPQESEIEENNKCEHNWILFRGNIEEPEEIGGNLNSEELFNEIKKEIETCEVIPVEEIKTRLTETKVGVDFFNQLNQDYEKMYTDIVQSSGLNITLPQFRSLMEDICLYGDDQHQFIKLLNSKIIQKYSNVAIGKLGIATSLLIEKLSMNLLERADNLSEDEIGDNNNKLIQLGSKSLREYLGLLKELKEFEVPEVNRKIQNIKEKEQEKEEIKLSPSDIQSLLNKVNSKDDEIEDNENKDEK